jgi:hypothetical protein
MVKQDVSRNFPGRPIERGFVLPRSPWVNIATIRNALSFVPKKTLVLSFSDGGN